MVIALRGTHSRVKPTSSSIAMDGTITTVSLVDNKRVVTTHTMTQVNTNARKPTTPTGLRRTFGTDLVHSGSISGSMTGSIRSRDLDDDDDDERRFRSLERILDMQELPATGYNVSFLYPERYSHIYSNLKSRNLDIHGRDWGRLVASGYNWTTLQLLVQKFTHIQIGTAWLSQHQIQHDAFKKFLQFDNVLLYFVNDQELDRRTFVRQTISTLKGLISLLPAPFGQKPLQVEATILLPLLANAAVQVETLRVRHCQITGVATCNWLSTIMNVSLTECSFPDGGRQFWGAATQRHASSIQTLALRNVANMDSALLAQAILGMGQLKALSLEHGDAGMDWNPILKAASASTTLQRIFVNGEYDTMNWLRGIVMLLHNRNTTQIGYRLRSARIFTAAEKMAMSMGILTAVQHNRCIHYLDIDAGHVVQEVMDRRILPITRTNKARPDVIETTNEVLADTDYSGLAAVLCHATVRTNPDLLFEVVSRTHELLADCHVAWDSSSDDDESEVESSLHEEEALNDVDVDRVRGRRRNRSLDGSRSISISSASLSISSAGSISSTDDEDDDEDDSRYRRKYNANQHAIQSEIRSFFNKLLPGMVTSRTSNAELGYIHQRLRRDFSRILDDAFEELGDGENVSWRDRGR